MYGFLKFPNALSTYWSRSKVTHRAVGVDIGVGGGQESVALICTASRSNPMICHENMIVYSEAIVCIAQFE